MKFKFALLYNQAKQVIGNEGARRVYNYFIEMSTGSKIQELERKLEKQKLESVNYKLKSKKYDKEAEKYYKLYKSYKAKSKEQSDENEKLKEKKQKA